MSTLHQPAPETDPLGEPAAIKIDDAVNVERQLQKPHGLFSCGGLLTIGALGIIGAGLLLPATSTRCKGATATTRLQMLERTAHIEALIEQMKAQNEDQP